MKAYNNLVHDLSGPKLSNLACLNTCLESNVTRDLSTTKCVTLNGACPFERHQYQSYLAWY